MDPNDGMRTRRTRAAGPATAALAALLLFCAAGAAGAQTHGFGGGPRLSHGGGHGGRGGGLGRARPAVYEIVTVSAVTDAAGLKASLSKLGASLAGSGGRMLVDADDPTAVAGAAPAHLAVLVFDDAFSATKWQASAAFKGLAAEIGKGGTLQVSAAGGIADPGTPPTVSVEALGGAPARNRLPDVPKINDICRGC